MAETHKINRATKRAPPVSAGGGIQCVTFMTCLLGTSIHSTAPLCCFQGKLHFFSCFLTIVRATHAFSSQTNNTIPFKFQQKCTWFPHYIASPGAMVSTYPKLLSMRVKEFRQTQNLSYCWYFNAVILLSQKKPSYIQ